MPEYHPGTDVEIPDHVPTSGFRNAIPNPKRYMKPNDKTIADVAKASYEGDFDILEMLLSRGDETNLFNGDLNEHTNKMADPTKGPPVRYVLTKTNTEITESNIPINGAGPATKFPAVGSNSNVGGGSKQWNKSNIGSSRGVAGVTPLHLAAIAGQAECIELLLQAKADPHVRECVSYGMDPEDGKTALDLAQEYGWSDCADLLTESEKSFSYGWYVPEGVTNNKKFYGRFEWERKPDKSWFMSRPGAARRSGLDPAKYGDVEVTAEEEMPESMLTMPSEPPLAIALLFPGQGSQYMKMMSTVKSIPAVAEMIEKSKEILDFDVLELCMEGPETKLEQTKFCQPAMFIAGLAGVEKLRSDREEAVTRPMALAGLSLGEYTALCHAGVFTFEEGLKLVKLRGEVMSEAATVGDQAMLSVAGVEKSKLEELCVEAQKKEGGGAVCQIANELFPKGFSCGGNEKAILELKDLAEKAGALQAKVLKTSGGFHTPLMKPAQEKLGAALDEMLPRMKPPRFTVYMNATGSPVKPGTPPKVIVDLLKRQLTNRVMWEPSMRAIIRDGCAEYFEVGPMKQIKAMMKRIDSKAWGMTTNVEV